MIEVTFHNDPQYPVRESEAEATVSRVFLVHDVTIAHVGVWIVDEAEMTRLNENYKHHVGSTDVLTFALRDPEQPTPTFLETAETEKEFGDIFLCWPVIEAEAKEQSVPTEEKFAFLLEHGCLHLLGIHHD